MSTIQARINENGSLEYRVGDRWAYGFDRKRSVKKVWRPSTAYSNRFKSDEYSAQLRYLLSYYRDEEGFIVSLDSNDKEVQVHPEFFFAMLPDITRYTMSGAVPIDDEMAWAFGLIRYDWDKRGYVG